MLKITPVICFICLCCVHALPHCKVVDFPEAVIEKNTINVIYTMESSCKYCARKASMLPELKASLRKSGINAHFIVALSHKSSRLSGLSTHLTIDKRQLWKTLGEQNNHFYIIDRCGRMVYEILNPWSSLQMPFLRGAVIATQFSHPCGLCPQDYTEVKEEKLKMYPEMVEETQPHTEEIPLGIVMRLRHKHHGDPNVYNHIVMTANGMPGHHRHLPHETNNNKIKSKSIFSLDIPEGNEESSVSNKGDSDSSAKQKQLSVENSINSIKNLDSSLRMANETQLSLGSSDTKDISLVNRVPSDTNTEINFTESNDPETSQEISSSTIETLQELDSSNTETTTEINENYEDISDDDYDEGSKESQNSYENRELDSREVAEKQNLKEHYGRILDWIKYDY